MKFNYRDVFLGWLGGIASTLLLASFVIAGRILDIGSLTSDPSTSRTFPVNMHGVVYVYPEIGRWYNYESVATIFVGSAFVLAIGVIGYLKQKEINPD